MTKLIILGIICIVLFGGDKVSGFMTDLAKGIKNFKKTLEEEKDEDGK